MSNKKSRLDKLESASVHLSRSAVVTYSCLGRDQDYTAPDARFKIGNEDDIIYDEIQASDYAFIAYMPVKNANKWNLI